MKNKLLQQAVDRLHQGELVAFPTETVYGLGADATNSAAVRKIFAAKGRPSTNPLIVHVADAEIARNWTTAWNDRAEMLAQAFWPGPLTLVLHKRAEIVDEATAGLGTVGLRVPNHPVALELLRAFAGPVAAPSANRSNYVSPTVAQHVRNEFGDRVPLILEGGPCKVGIESTVLDITAEHPRILRPGGISREKIEKVLDEPVLANQLTASIDRAAVSPGQLPVHYAPRAPAFRFNSSQWQAVQNWVLDHPGSVVFYLGESMPNKPADYARVLYANLRNADTAGATTILIEMPPDEPAWTAVRDRLLRATLPWKT